MSTIHITQLTVLAREQALLEDIGIHGNRSNCSAWHDEKWEMEKLVRSIASLSLVSKKASNDAWVY